MIHSNCSRTDETRARSGTRIQRLLALVAVSMLVLCGAAQGQAPASDAAKASDTKEKKEKKKKKGPKVTGYIQFHYNLPIDTDGNGRVAESRFRVQRARVTLEGDVNDRVSYELDIDPRSPQITGVMRDAFFNYKVNDNLTLRFGQQKTKFGYINQRSSSRLYTVNRPELADELSRGINLRDIGVSVLGKRPLGEGRSFDYAVSLVNGAGLNVQRDNNKRKNVFGRIGLRSKDGGNEWRLGLSGANGDMFETSNRPEFNGGYFRTFNRVGGDFLINRSRYRMAGEYIVGNHKEKERDREETIHGYYLLVVAKMTPTMGPLVQYDGLDFGDYSRLTVGAFYEPEDDFRILLNYEARPGDDRVYLWSLVRF